MTADNPFKAISALDYTVIFARDMAVMVDFYETIMGFTLSRTLSENWREYNIGPNTFVLARPRNAPVPPNSATVQLAFKVPLDTVDACANTLAAQNIPILSPPTNHDFGHRTLFFHDPDGNLLEIYAQL